MFRRNALSILCLCGRFGPAKAAELETASTFVLILFSIRLGPSWGSKISLKDSKKMISSFAVLSEKFSSLRYIQIRTIAPGDFDYSNT